MKVIEILDIINEYTKVYIHYGDGISGYPKDLMSALNNEILSQVVDSMDVYNNVINVRLEERDEY